MELGLERLFLAAAPGAVDFVKQDSGSGRQNPDGTPIVSNFITVRQAPLEMCDYLHLRQNSAAVSPGDRVREGQHLADVGDTGVNVGGFHLHIAVTNLGEGHKTQGSTFVTIPAPYTNYDASDDGGSTWFHVLRGVPQAGQWIRRPAPSSDERYTAVWSYDDYRAKYDEPPRRSEGRVRLYSTTGSSYRARTSRRLRLAPSQRR